MRCKVVRRPFWIFRGESAFCFDANVLYDYVAAESDCADLFTRQPYSRAELFALAFTARRPHLTLESVAARRVELDARREVVTAMETEVADVLQQMAEAFPEHANSLCRELLEAFGDLAAIAGLPHAHFFLAHAIERHRRGLERDRFRYFSAEVRTLCVVAMLRHQI